MKRLLALMCAVLIVGFSLCACSEDTVKSAKQTASEAMSDIKKDLTQNTDNKDGMGKNDRATIAATEPVESAADDTDIGEMIETEWNDMVDDGEVNDGDGNVGDLENKDGDGNVDDAAAE